MDLDESSLKILKLGRGCATEVLYRAKEWPRKTVPLARDGRSVAVLSQDDRLQLLDPVYGSLTDLDCVVGGEPVSDVCLYPTALAEKCGGGGKSLLVVVTASGRALKVEPLKNLVVGAVDEDLRVEQSEPGTSPVKGKSVGENGNNCGMMGSRRRGFGECVFLKLLQLR